MQPGRAKGAITLTALKVRDAPSIEGKHLETLPVGRQLIFLVNRIVQAGEYLFAPLADLSGRHVAYAKLNPDGTIQQAYLDTREEIPLEQPQLVAGVRQVAAMMRYRKSKYHILFFNSGDDGVINLNSEVYDPNRRDAGMHFQAGLDLIESMLPLFGLTPLPPSDDVSTPYAELPIQTTPILAPPMSPVIDLDMLNEVAAFASYLRFDVSKMHVRYAPEGWREDKTKLIEHPHALSAAMDMLLIASMLETMVSHLGGQRPIPPRNEMVIYRNYDFYQQLAKRIYDQSKPAITAPLSPQAATSEWVQTAAIPGTVDWAALLTPIVEQIGKMVLSMLQQWLAGKIQTR